MSVAAASSVARREHRVAHRRQGILDAAARIFRDVGYERATLDTIGDAVGLSKASLYYYVRSKEELLGRLLSGVIEEIARRATHDLPIRSSAEERLRRFLVAHVEVVCGDPTGVLLTRHQDVVLGATHSRSMRAARRRHEESLEAILAQGFAAKAFRKLDARMVAYLILGALHGVPRWHDRLPGTTPDEIAEGLFSLVLDGLRARSTSTSRRSAHAK
jgi:TetR/AcrR family transcriptional regulator, cholesterol catabolism regulator